MANLNTVEGHAHAEMDDDCICWRGYILVEPNLANIRYFEPVECASRNNVYEGPVFRQGAYYFVCGKVRIIQTIYNLEPKELRVEFEGIEPLINVKALRGRPVDFLDFRD